MTLENEIEEIKKKLEDHEKRIKKLEGPDKLGKKESTKKKVSILDHLSRLKSQGFFDQPKLANEIVKKLATEGYHYPAQSLTWSLQRAVRTCELGRVKKDSKWAYCKR